MFLSSLVSVFAISFTCISSVFPSVTAQLKDPLFAPRPTYVPPPGAGIIIGDEPKPGNGKMGEAICYFGGEDPRPGVERTPETFLFANRKYNTRSLAYQEYKPWAVDTYIMCKGDFPTDICPPPRPPRSETERKDRKAGEKHKLPHCDDIECPCEADASRDHDFAFEYLNKTIMAIIPYCNDNFKQYDKSTMSKNSTNSSSGAIRVASSNLTEEINATMDSNVTNLPLHIITKNSPTPPTTRILSIGLGSAVVNHYLRKHCSNNIEIDTIEIVSESLTKAKKFFGFVENEENERVHITDAKKFVVEYAREVKRAMKEKKKREKKIEELERLEQERASTIWGRVSGMASGMIFGSGENESSSIPSSIPEIEIPPLFDAVIIDCFVNDAVIPDACKQQRFYSHLKKIMSERSVVAQNVFGPNNNHGEIAMRYAKVFGDKKIRMARTKGAGGRDFVLEAYKGEQDWKEISDEELKMRQFEYEMAMRVKNGMNTMGKMGGKVGGKMEPGTPKGSCGGKNEGSDSGDVDGKCAA